MATSIGERVGHRIRELRLEAGLSQAQLAERLPKPVESETISRYERGTREPSLDRIGELAAALGTDFDGFFTGMIEAGAGKVRSKELHALVGLLASRNPTQLRGVRQLLQAHFEAVDAAVGSSGAGPG